MLDNFSGGLDLRFGRFSGRQNRLRELLNAFITNGLKIKRRPPLKKITGQIGANASGLVFSEGKWYSFCKRGDAPGHTDDVATFLTETLFFDAPEYTTTWSLVDFDVIDGWPVALIRHTFPGTAHTERLCYHVWDEAPNLPTYVQDPFVPNEFVEGFPVHAYGTGTLPTFKANQYLPIGQGASKGWLALGNGKARATGVAGQGRTYNLRVWNSHDLDDAKELGEWFYFVTPTGQGDSLDFYVPLDPADLDDDRKYSAYVLEYLDATGTWQKFVEDAVDPTVHGRYRPLGATNPWAGGDDVIRLRVYWTGAADTILRFRAISGAPPVQIVNGCTLAETLIIQRTANGADRVYDSDHPFSDIDANFALYYNTALLTKGTDFNFVSDPVDGSGRAEFAYWKIDDWPNSGTPGSPTPATALTTTYPWSTWSAYGTESGVYVNGVKKTLTTHYTVSDDGGFVRVTWVVGQEPAIGATVEVIFVPTASLIVEFKKGDWGLTAGTYLFEDEPQQFDGTAFVLATNTKYLVAVSHDASIVAALHANPTVDMPLNGYQRYHCRIIKRIETDAASPIALTQDDTYYYGYEEAPASDVSKSSWYVDKEVELEAAAGSGDATELNTAVHEEFGETILAFGNIKNRLTVHYKSSMQLWAIDPDPTLMSFLDGQPGGLKGDNHFVTPFYGTLIAPSPLGFRSVSLVGFNADSMRDLGIGDPVAAVFPLNMKAAAYWPWQGWYISGGVDSAGAFKFYMFNFSQQSRVSAWSRFSCAGISNVNHRGLIPADDKLYVVSGQDIYYFDASASVFRDDNDTAGVGNAYESKVAFHFDDLNRPDALKRFLKYNVVQTGKSEVGFRFNPADEDVEWTELPFTDTTYGASPPLPMAVTAPGLAAVLRSTDETGWELERVAMRYMMLER